MRWNVWLPPLVVLGIVFASNYAFVVNHMFHDGYLYDSGLFAGLVYRNPWLQHAPAISGQNYFSTHFTPVLQLFSLLSYLVPLPLPFYYAFTQGIVYTILACGGLVALAALFPSEGPRWPLLTLGLLFAYSGPVQAAIHFPHFEPVYAGFALLFLAALVDGRNLSTWTFFFCTLIVREDTGFHLFGILFLMLLASYFEPDLSTYRSRLALFSALSLLYSLAVMAVQKNVFPGDDALSRVYLGDPLYSHLTAEFLTRRASTLVLTSAYLWPAWLLLAVGAWRLRSLSFSVGFFALLPWFALHALAINEKAGSFFAYYSFPFIVVLLWPALWFRFKGRPERLRKAVVGGQALLLALSFGFITWRHSYIVSQMLTWPEADLPLYHRLSRIVDEEIARPGTYFDNALMTLFPDRIPRERAVAWAKDHHLPSERIVGLRTSSERGLPREMALLSGLDGVFVKDGAAGQIYLLAKVDSNETSNWNRISERVTAYLAP